MLDARDRLKGFYYGKTRSSDFLLLEELDGLNIQFLQPFLFDLLCITERLKMIEWMFCWQ